MIQSWYMAKSHYKVLVFRRKTQNPEEKHVLGKKKGHICSALWGVLKAVYEHSRKNKFSFHVALK